MAILGEEEGSSLLADELSDDSSVFFRGSFSAAEPDGGTVSVFTGAV